MENIVYDFPLSTSIPDMPLFISTPKPREPTEKEIDKFSLRYYNEKKTVMKPAFEHTGNVWCAADNGRLPTYRLYTCGTNYLKVLKYTPDKNIWEEIKIDDIDTLYSMLWLMCLKLQEATTTPMPFDAYMTLISGGNYYEQQI